MAGSVWVLVEVTEVGTGIGRKISENPSSWLVLFGSLLKSPRWVPVLGGR